MYIVLTFNNMYVLLQDMIYSYTVTDKTYNYTEHIKNDVMWTWFAAELRENEKYSNISVVSQLYHR